MNPHLKSYIDKIHGALDTLEKELLSVKKEIKSLEEEREETRRENWRYIKEINTLTSLRKDYEALQEENEAYRGRYSELEERLQRILSHTKALSNEFRP